MTLRIVLTDGNGIAGLTGVFGAFIKSANAATAASAAAAAASAVQAASSATNASSSASASATSASNSANSATSSANSATASASSATASQSSATASATSATQAAGSATAASTSEGNAATSAANANTSAGNAGISAGNASTSASAAAASAASAANSAAAFNGELTVNTTGGTTTLSTSDAANGIFKVAGTLTSNATIVLPATPHTFAVQNLTTGSFTLTVKAQSQTPSVQVVQGKSATMFVDPTGCYAISAAPGISWANLFAYSGNQTLSISHLGAEVTQSAASTTTFPKASTYPAGSGFGFRNAYTGAGVNIALQAGDTATDLTFPFATQPNDSMFWYSDGVSQWILGFYSNRPPTFYVPLPPYVVTPAINATSFAPTGGYSPGFEALYRNGVRLVSGTDYTATDGVNITFTTFVGDGLSQLMLMRQTPVTYADVVQKSNPILGAALTFADGSQENTAQSGRNRVINGCCRVMQRANSLVVATGFAGYGGPDRFLATNANSAGGQFTQSQYAMTRPDGAGIWAVKQVVNTAISSTTGTNSWFGITQTIEGLNCWDMQNKPAVLSFLFDTNVAGTYSVSICNSPTTYSFLATFVAVAGVQKVVIPVPSLPNALSIPATNAAGLFIRIGALNTGTWATAANPNAWQSGTFICATGAVNWGAAANNYIGIGELQFEAGNTVATPFERRSIAHETLLCMRYYEAGGLTIQSPVAGFMLQTIPFAAQKRVAPTLAFTSTTYSNASSLTNNTALVGCFQPQFNASAASGYVNSSWSASAEL